MLIKLTAGTVYDPANSVDGEVRDLYISDDRISNDPGADAKLDAEYDLRGMVVMAGAIDMHTHIGGGKVNVARTLMPEFCRQAPVERSALTRSGCSKATPSTLLTG